MPTSTDDLVSLRQLCALGLPAKLLVQPALELVSRILQANSCAFVWMDRHLRPTGAYAQGHADFEWLLGTIERHELEPRPGGGVTQVRRFLVEGADGPIGALHVLRKAPDAAPFADDDAEPHVRRYLALGLARCQPRDFSTYQTRSLGLIVFAHDVGIEYCDDRARHWLYLVGADAAARRNLHTEGVRRAVERVVERLHALAIDAANRPPGAPAVELQTEWGQFGVRPVGLADWRSPGRGRRAMVIEQRVPTVLRAFESIADLPLSARQREVCRLLVEGHSHGEIAALCGIARHTVVANVRAIFQKLGVHRVAHLRERILLST